MMKIKVLLVSLLYFLQTSLSFANDESYGSVYKFILSKSVILNEYEDFATTPCGLFNNCNYLCNMLLQAKVIRYLLAQFISKSFRNSLPC